ncbi:MAG: iron ABC transporter permease [Victivallales bacterium]|nr:iron ABC transporter permease [Victivallales bacterium]
MLKRQSIKLFVGAVCCVLVVLAAPFVGSVSIDVPTVFWRIRVPRVLAGFLAGAGLSLCGMCYQGLFRNVLATPYTLGVSGGAALGVAIAVQLHLTGIGIQNIAAFLGAIGAFFLITGVSKLRHRGGDDVLLLAGVAVSFFFSSVIMFLQYIGTAGEVMQVMRWLMGSLDVYDYGEVALLACICAIGGAVIAVNADALNLLAIGDDFAASRGVSLARTKLLLHIAVSLTVGCIVAICGPIGFVGMVSPHVGRLLIGANHRRLVPVSLLFGGTLLVFCDALGRVILAPSELPVGIVTALLGGPFFLWMLLRKR